jgi:hypothetical protein
MIVMGHPEQGPHDDYVFAGAGINVRWRPAISGTK